MANAASRQPVTAHGISYLGSPLTLEDLNEVRLSVLDYLFPIIPALGEAWNVVADVLMSLYLGKLVVGCGIRIWVLYTERGCGCWLIGALWGTLFTLLWAPVGVLKGATRRLRDLDQGEERAFMSRVPPGQGPDGVLEGAYQQVVSPSEKLPLFEEDVERRAALGKGIPTILVDPRDPSRTVVATISEETSRPDLQAVSQATGDAPTSADRVARYLNRRDD